MAGGIFNGALFDGTITGFGASLLFTQLLQEEKNKMKINESKINKKIFDSFFINNTPNISGNRGYLLSIAIMAISCLDS